MNYYERLALTCKENGISPTALLKKLNISTSKLTAWKNGSMPNSEFVVLISEYFGISIDYLLTGKKSPPPELSEEEQKCLKAFKQLKKEDRIAFVARMEQKAEDYPPEVKENVS